MRSRRTRVGVSSMLAGAVLALGSSGAVMGQDATPRRKPPFEAANGGQQQIAAPRTTPARPDPTPATYVPHPVDLHGVAIDPRLEDCVRRLGDPVYGMREQAMAELRAADFSNTQLYAALETLPLTAEQRHRVLTVLHDRLLFTPRGAVGIKVDQRFLPDKIVVLELLPLLPAREVLQIGDRITHLDGRPLTGWQEFVDAVQSQPPGVKINVTVRRAVSDEKARRDAGNEPRFETMQIAIELGSTDLLTDPQTGRPQTGGPVWERRKREADDAMRVWGPQPRPVEVEGG